MQAWAQTEPACLWSLAPASLRLPPPTLPLLLDLATLPLCPLASICLTFCASMCLSAGSPNASVLPEPVEAMPIRSCPDMMMGQH